MLLSLVIGFIGFIGLVIILPSLKNFTIVFAQSFAGGKAVVVKQKKISARFYADTLAIYDICDD